MSWVLGHDVDEDDILLDEATHRFDQCGRMESVNVVHLSDEGTPSDHSPDQIRCKG